MMDWLAQYGSELVLVMFFAMFLAFAAWAYAPSNKKRMNDNAAIPLRENINVEP